MGHAETRLRIVIVHGGPRWLAWQAACVRLLASCERAEVVAAVESAEAAPPMSSAIWRRAWGRLGQRAGGALRPVDRPTALVGLRRLDVHGTGSAAAADLGPVDAVLALGPATIPTWLATAARLGVWGFDHDLRVARSGEPPCLGEMLARSPTVAVSLIRVGAGQPDQVIHAGAVSVVRKSFARTLDAVLFDCAHFPARACAEAAARGDATGPEPTSRTAVAPTTVAMLRLLAVQCTARFSDAFRWLCRHEQWGIGLAECPIQSFLREGAAPPRVRWIAPNGRSGFVADPFGVRTSAGLAIVAEELRFDEGRGVLSIIDWPDGSPAAPPRRFLQLPVHLSYPYLVEDEGGLFMIPETAEAEEVALYRCDRVPDRWSRVATLINGFAALDSTVFKHDGRWWLLAAASSPANTLTLHAWHAPALVGPWSPHALNPLKTDVGSARPAGTPFVHDGRLYRPAQDCSTEYGGAVVLMRIDRLTPDEFSESPVRVIRPDPSGPYPDGLHTLSSVIGPGAAATVLDGKRRVFVPALFRRELSRMLRRAAGRRPPLQTAPPPAADSVAASG